MNLKYLLTIFCLFYFTTSLTLAQASPTDKPASDSTQEDSAIQKKINDLKERLATRVAELKEQNKRAFAGVIKEKKDDEITIVSKDLEMKANVPSETPVSSKTARGKFTKADAKALVIGQNVVAFGTLDLAQKILTARFLIVYEMPVVLTGRVESINTKEGSFTIDSSDGRIILDYEIGTKCMLLSTDDDATTCGLSKMKIGNFVIVRMLQSDTNITRATALRIVLLPGIPTPEKSEPTPSSPTPTNE